MFQFIQMKDKKLPFVLIVNVILFILIIFTIFFPRFYRNLFLKDTPVDRGKQDQAVEIQNSFRNVFQASKNSVVSIRSKKNQIISPFLFNESAELQKLASLGSGFMIDKKGYILTNFHVIKKAEIIEVIDGNGRVYKANYVGSHEIADIAILKISSNNQIQPVVFGDSNTLEVGDWAIAVGSPYGLEKSFTVGVVSAKYREDLDETGLGHIQTDTAINPGSSGGPLLNIYGEVIGINRMVRSNTGENTGIGFAIPSNFAVRIIRKILSDPGKHIRPTTLGVKATIPQPEHRKILKIEGDGVLIYAIRPGSSAAKGGIQRYDFITHAGDSSIKDINDLRKQIGLVGRGGRLKLDLIRQGRKISLYINL